MRILLTNNTLDLRGGSELYIRDVAIELMRRGHQPVAYSTRLGDVAQELRAATVPVVNRIDSLGEPPDIIHGHHHYETFTALLQFPQTPAIYFCHGWTPWEEAPLVSPQVYRYVAVSVVCRERLLTEGGIAPERVELLPNFYDEARFPARAPLPDRPKLACAFGHTFGNRDIAILRAACASRGIELHAIGLGTGNPEDNPGPRLAQYDVVFASGRAAIEALAVGASVILGSQRILGPLVTTSNFAALRLTNFGLRSLSKPLNREGVVRALDQFDAQDSKAVSAQVRRECGLQPAVDRLEQLYSEAIQSAGQVTPPAVMAGSQAAARYLECWSARYKTAAQSYPDGAPPTGRGYPILSDYLQENERLTASIRHLQGELEAMRESATWRWTQRTLRNPLVQALFGPLIRATAERSIRRRFPTSTRGLSSLGSADRSASGD